MTKFTRKYLSNDLLTKKFFADVKFIHTSASGAMGDPGVFEVWTKNFEHYHCYWADKNFNVKKFEKAFMKDEDTPYFDNPTKNGWCFHYMGCGNNFYIKEELNDAYLKKFDEGLKNGANYPRDEDVFPVEEIMFEILTERMEHFTWYDKNHSPKILKTAIYGAILGDIIGSPFEFDNEVDGVRKSKNFKLFNEDSCCTDDTVMTVAIAEALLVVDKDADEKTVCNAVIKFMQKWGKKYPHAGYGSKFKYWLKEKNPQPYNSWGNGSAMRISAVGWLYDTLERTREVARWTAQVSHNHPEGIKGAEAVASAIFLARHDKSKEEIKTYIETEFGYNFNRTLNDIRPSYHHVESCQETVPEAFTAFFESTDFEDAIRNAVSLGGDADTLTCIDGAIAEAFYGVPENLVEKCRQYLPKEFLKIVYRFNEKIFSNKINWREHNKKIAAETMKITDCGFYEKDGEKINLVGKNFDEIILISPEQSEEIEKNLQKFFVKDTPKIFVVNEDTFSMSKGKTDKKILAMNFANAKYPGGGFLNGANAQEESLCRESTLFKSLSSSEAKKMYDYNFTHNKHCYSDFMTISPNVCVFRDIKDDFLPKPFLTSVITLPAPNLNGAAKNVPQEKIDEIMIARLRKMFNAAIYYKYTDLVLGAWGCGAFGHNPYKVAKYFYKLLFEEGYKFCFERIIFAIYDKGEKKNFKAFSEVFETLN